GGGKADIAGRLGIRARSSAGEHFLDMEGVTGSIPVAPTIPSAQGDLRTRRRRTAPRFKTCVAESGLAVTQRLAIRPEHASACSKQHGVTRRRVPLHGWCQPRIDIGRAFRDQAELE